MNLKLHIIHDTKYILKKAKKDMRWECESKANFCQLYTCVQDNYENDDVMGVWLSYKKESENMGISSKNHRVIIWKLHENSD